MQPTIYSAAAHHIRQENIDSDALYVMSRLREAGYTCYLVGGSVRDLLVGHLPKDFDISTSARPEEVKRLFRRCLLIGRRFRLAHVRFGHKVIEVATFRAGDTSEGELIVRDNAWGTEEQDVLRRDFTINGLYYNSADDTVIDYVGGYKDLRRRLIRTIGNPEVRFKQDPVRMIRLLKFRARFGFAVEPQTWQALLQCRAEIQKSAPARVLEEFFKMLESGASAPFFRLMSTCGLLDYLFPKLTQFLKEPKGKWVFTYLEALDHHLRRYKKASLERPVLISALLFPILESQVEAFYAEKNRWPEFGETLHLTEQLLDDYLLASFSSFPRKMRASISFVLSVQYRLTPPDQKKNYRTRLLQHPEFMMALKFLKLRATIEPNTVKETYNEWKEHLQHSASHKQHMQEVEISENLRTEFLESL